MQPGGPTAARHLPADQHMIAILIRRLERVTLVAAGLSVVLLMLVTSGDAIGRYAFNSPLPWASEVATNYLMILASYFALSATFQRGDHIHIDLIQRRLPKAFRARMEAIYSLLGAIVFCIILRGSWKNMVDAYVGKEFMPGYIMWPAWPSHLLIVIGSTVLVLRLLHHSWTMAHRGEDPAVETVGETVE